MNAETRKALKGSIAKWRRIVNGTRADKGVENCPLCELFVMSLPDMPFDSRDCNGCPVFQKTRHRGCIGSPYGEALDQLNQSGFARTLQAKDAARKELAFLLSLLPKRKKARAK